MKKIGFHRVKEEARTDLFGLSEMVRVFPEGCVFDEPRHDWEGYTDDDQLLLNSQIREELGEVEYPE